jgi:acyl-CoA synthetase (AMP-forming)/AMP-acid ligase II
MVELMLARLDSSFDRPAVCDALDGGRTWTWGEVIAAAVELATTFETMGVRRGHRLAHLGSHSPDWIVVDLACQLAGVVHVPLHADTTAREQAASLSWLAPQGMCWSGAARGGDPAAGIPI